MFCKELGHTELAAELCSLFQHVYLIRIGRGGKSILYTILSRGQNSENNRGTIIVVSIIQIVAEI